VARAPVRNKRYEERQENAESYNKREQEKRARLLLATSGQQPCAQRRYWERTAEAWGEERMFHPSADRVAQPAA